MKRVAVTDSSELAERWRVLLDIDRGLARAYGQETLGWLNAEAYVTDSGRTVDLSSLIASCLEGTIEYPPDREASTMELQVPREARIEVSNETSLSAALRLVGAGGEPLVLNMANGVSPGGGWLKGSRAQEEYLCRSSALWVTIKDSPMYAAHAASGHYESSDWLIVSPDVPVFRDDTGFPLDEPWVVSFMTCAAPVASRVGAERSAMLLRDRINRVLQIAACEGYTSLVLGAWGCGAFGNDPRATAESFRDALEGPFANAFDAIVFAITDWNAQRQFLGPFADVFQE